MTTRATPAERQARRAEITRARRRGESQRSIADRLGISRAMVQKELRAIAAVPEARPEPAPTRRAAVSAIVKPVTNGASVGSGFATILPPADHFGAWRRLDLDRDTWTKADPERLLSILLSISPDVSRAVWDWLRLLNPGHEIIAYKRGAETPDKRAQTVLNAFIARLEANHGSFKALAGRVFMAAVTRGAFFAELVLDETGRVPLDIATPDPALVRFKLVDDPERGQRWVPGQWQDGTFVAFDAPTVIYMPLDPEMGSPYGRPMIAPSIFPAIFILGVIHDLRRVIAQQGYSRTDIVVKLEALRAAFTELDDEEFQETVDELIAKIGRDYSRLEPDDAYVHTDPIEVKRADGAVDASAMGGAESVLSGLERMATRALKSMPLLMGFTDGVSEANANRQWEIYVAGVKTVQHHAEALFGRLLTLALQAQGIVANVVVRFAEVRAAEELRDSQTFIAKLKGAELAERLGFFTPDEAAIYATGHGVPAELSKTRVPLLNTPGGSVRPTDATKVGGNERSVRRSTAGSETELTDARLEEAAIAWRRAFAGRPEESLLDAEVEA